MRISVIRHLPTEWNKKGLLQGRKNLPLLPLSDKEKNSIIDNKRFLEQFPQPKLVLSSTLQRTVDTARHYGYEPFQEPLLDEWDFGTFEGRSKEQLIATFGKCWFEQPEKIQLGESGKELQVRIQRFILSYKHYEHILIFGHGSWIRALLSFAKRGHINFMNKIKFDNNQCASFLLHPMTKKEGYNVPHNYL